MLTASVENMLVTSIDTTLETGVVLTQYVVIMYMYMFWWLRVDIRPQRLKDAVAENFSDFFLNNWSWLNGKKIEHYSMKVTEIFY